MWIFMFRTFRSRFWVGYQYVITTQNHSLVGQWEVKGKLGTYIYF